MPRTAWLASLLLALAACVARPLPIPDASHAQAAGIPLARLSEGRRIYGTACSGCHRLYQPAEISPGRWREMMPTMAGKAKLTEDQSAAVLAYLLTVR